MVKKISILLLLSIVLFSCAKQEEKKVVKEEVATLTVSELAKEIGSYTGKTIRIKGTVSHVCRKSGKKLFIAGSEEGQNFKITAGESISVFDMALEGTEVTVEGKLVKAEVVNEGRDDHEEHDHANEDADNCSTSQIADYSLECVKLIKM